MSGRFVRSSKYRHVFGRPTKKEQCYDNLRISKNAWDSNIIKANPRYVSVNWEASGGGAFAVIPVNEKGRAPDRLPLFRDHTSAVLDTDWNPFDDSLIASGGDDAKVLIWRVPEDFTLHTNTADDEEVEDVKSIRSLTGHRRKVGHVLFNPAADNVLASSSGDFTVALWDVEAGKAPLSLTHPDTVQSLSWNASGKLLVTTCRDKKLRVWDVRSKAPAAEVPGHSGGKNSRVVWMGEHDRIATTGFSRMSDRQLGLWAIGTKEPIGGFQILDSISGVCMPFWDDGTQCLYLAGKGDGNIRYYEYENDKFEYLSEYKSGEPQRGIAFLPKRGVNMHENEVARAYKSVNDAYIEPIPFIVPRRSEMFQSDIYSPTIGIKPGVSSAEWWDGKDAVPPKIDMESVYNGEAAREAPPSTKPVTSAATPTPSPTTSAPAPKEAPLSTAQASQVSEEAAATTSPSLPVNRGPPPSIKDSSTSIADAASKFVDKEGSVTSEDEAETSSFEDIAPRKGPPAPVSTGQTALRQAVPPGSAASVRTPQTATSQTSILSPKGETSRPRDPGLLGSGQREVSLQGSLDDIRDLLKKQNETIAAQSAQLERLTSEMSELKSRSGNSYREV